MVGADDATFARAEAGSAGVLREHHPRRPAGPWPDDQAHQQLRGAGDRHRHRGGVRYRGQGGRVAAKLHEVISAGAVNSGIFQMIVGRMLDNKGDLTGLKFTLVNAMKDLRYYTHFAESLPVCGIVGEAVHQSLVNANLLGFGDKYVASLVEAQESSPASRSCRADPQRPDRQPPCGCSSSAARDSSADTWSTRRSRGASTSPSSRAAARRCRGAGRDAAGREPRSRHRAGAGRAGAGDMGSRDRHERLLPRCVGASARLLAERFGHCLFVSSLSVYADAARGAGRERAGRGARGSSDRGHRRALRRAQGGQRAQVRRRIRRARRRSSALG